MTALRWRGAQAALLAAALLAVPAAAEPEAPPPGQIPVALNGAPPAGVEDPAVPEPDPLLDDDALFEEEESPVYDPFESGNRVIFRFNQSLGRWVWEPVTRGYRFVLPGTARRALRRALNNLNTPIYVMNHLLRLHVLDAAETLGAFAMNSTFGVGGLIDTASGVGFELKPADFGETLALAGVGSGPYLVFPIVGPTTARDGFGFIVDRAFHPLTYLIGVPVQLVGYGGVGIARRDAVHDELKALYESSLDPYAVLRSAYIQARTHSIEELRHGDDAPAAPPD